MSALAIKIRGLHKSFGSVHALRGLDLDVPVGSIFGVVGPNGAGKTTLFSVVSGFLPASSGEVHLAGFRMSPGTPPPAGTFAILPQDAGFVDGMPLGVQLVHYGRLQGLPKRQARDEAERVLDLVGLPEVFKRKARTLSHGMHKRVGIAQAFIGNPSVVILDEPTAGLDPHAARDVRALVRRITGDRTIVVSSHNLGEIEDLCEEIAIIHQGTRVRQDTVSTVIGDADLVLFRLARPSSAEEQRRLEALPFVTAVAWSERDERLRVHFDPALQAPGPAARDMIAALVDAGVPFLEMQVGKSLEERFIEETALS